MLVEEKINFYMREALLLAQQATSSGEVPVGAVVVLGNQIIAKAHNRVEELKDATAHAEVLALRDASKQLGQWRLSDAALFVTLEPCTMCIGAMQLARVSELYFGCYDKRAGAVGSQFNLASHQAYGREIKVYPEVCAEESAGLLREFFEGKR